MWVTVPSTFCPCAAATGESTSDCGWRSEMLARSVTWKTKRISATSWLKGWQRHAWMRLLFGAISEPSTAELGVARFIASLPDTRASRTARPDSSSRTGTPGTCGPTSPASCGRSDPTSSSLRTSPTTLSVDSSLSRMSYGKWTTALRRECLRRVKSVLRTTGNASLFWPGADRVVGRPLTWATPTARDWRDGSCTNANVPTNGLLGRQALRQGPNGRPPLNESRLLSPRFVEWAMGVPLGWSDSVPLGTESYRQWLRQHSSNLRTYFAALSEVTRP